MKKDQLKPWIYKIEGAANFALYDMLDGQLYRFPNQGPVKELRQILLDEGLIIETEGVTPHKIARVNLGDIQNKIMLRVLQVRLNGSSEDYCWSREKNGSASKKISMENLEQLKEQTALIPIETIRIEAEEADIDQIRFFLNHLKCDNVDIYLGSRPDSRLQDACKKAGNGKQVAFYQQEKWDIQQLEARVFHFFYGKRFNDCLGHQIAIDTGGEIKICLWSSEVLGQIGSGNLKNMILKGDFDSYWEMNKNRVKICKDCEVRLACRDCRISAFNENNDIDAKPHFCQYDPYEEL